MVCMVMVALPYLKTYRSDKLCSVGYHNQIKLCSIIVISIIFGLVFGMRWDVGTDNLEYLRIYVQNDTERYKNEFIFKLLNDSFKTFGIHYWIYFTIFASVQIFLLLYSIKNMAYLWVFVILSLFGGHFFIDWMNGMRQEMASCIMFLGTNYIITRNPFKYFLLIILAIGFHSSAVIFIVVYPLLVNGRSFVPSRLCQILLLVVSSAITLIVGDILSHIFPILDILQQMDSGEGYASRYNTNVLESYAEKTHIGIMFYVFFIINALVILYYKKLKLYFSGRRFTIYYNMYFWGMICETLLATNMILIRPFRYFRIYKLILIAYLLYYLYKHPSSLSAFIFLVLLSILLISIFIKASTTPFNFYFEIPYAP